MQTGFGPFISVYLTTQKWTQTDIGFVLSVGGLVALLGQMPGGAIVDAARSRAARRRRRDRRMIRVAALAYALLPDLSGRVQRARYCTRRRAACSGPCIAAISLGLVGHAAIGERLGRNARFASIGNGLAAAAMGAIGYFFSAQAVFFVTAALLIPTLFALRRIQPREIDPELAHGSRAAAGEDAARRLAQPAAQAAAVDLRRLHHAVPSRQRRDAAADGERPDHALGRMGDGADRRLHRGAADRRRADLALGRPAGADLGPPARCCSRLCRARRCAGCCSRP